MALEAYRKKRDFGSTGEPEGRKNSRRPGNSYLVQKHDARRLHYDLRLEMDGVLKSWAVTRGPSLVAGEKRLAVHVEDHPLEYGDFEGTIPKGEYGGGTVVLWDRGTWSPIGDPAEGYRKGQLDFELHGEKLSGRWHLVRMHGKRGEKADNWLLIKGDDDAARGKGDPDILEERPESVKTGRTTGEIAGEEPGWSSKTGRIESRGKPPVDAGAIAKAKKATMPAFVEPALASLRAAPPSGSRWMHEIKFDGYRLQARLSGGELRLLTRGGLDWTGRFGSRIAAALRDLPATSAIVDGELVVENGHGASDFAALQADLAEGRKDRFVYYAFDLLFLDGYDLRSAPLTERKAALERLVIAEDGPLRFSTAFETEGEIVLRHACRLSLEGVVSKLRDAPYRSGRGRNWVKSKCTERQEFVVAGYVPSSASRKAIGSLVLGYHEDGELLYAGRVGTGFSSTVSGELFRKLESRRRKTSPFANRLPAEASRGVRFAVPDLVAEVEFRGWTAERNLRHASFRGLREDRSAEEVVREASARSTAGRSPRRKSALTHPDRLMWPDAGVTKEGLADYYTDVWRWMAPFVAGRPLSLLRCPGGTGGECFFQKHAWKGLNKAVRLVRDPGDRSGKPMLSIDDLDGMLGLVQAGVLEVHPWGSSVASLERPDFVTMDLDPGDDVGWEAIVAAALEVRERLEQAGLAAFVKTSGGKGLHVVSPLEPAAGWETVKGFTAGIAKAMASDDPARYVATVSKAKRRGRILVDYLRNGRGATAVAPYSTRARPGAPVSMPLGWEELGGTVGAAYFTVENAPTRLLNLSRDPWGDFRAAAVPLPPGPERHRAA